MTDLSELFSRDPLQLSKQDIRTIVEEMRKSRHAFNAGNANAGNTKPKSEKQRAIASLAEKMKINL